MRGSPQSASRRSAGERVGETGMHDVRENVVCILLEYRRQVRRRKDLGNNYYISAATTAAAPTMATVMRAVELALLAATGALVTGALVVPPVTVIVNF